MFVSSKYEINYTLLIICVPKLYTFAHNLEQAIDESNFVELWKKIAGQPNHSSFLLFDGKFTTCSARGSVLGLYGVESSNRAFPILRISFDIKARKRELQQRNNGPSFHPALCLRRNVCIFCWKLAMRSVCSLNSPVVNWVTRVRQTAKSLKPRGRTH